MLGERLNSLPDKVHETRRFPLGIYRGLHVRHGAAPARRRRRCTWKAQTTRHGDALARSHGPRAVLNALDRLAGSYEAQAATARQDLAIAEGQLRDYQARLGQPFAHDAYLAELTPLRDQLKAGLSGATPEPARAAAAGRRDWPSGSRP